MEKGDERVLVVPTEVFHRIGHFQGFTRDVGAYLDVLLKPENIAYRPRCEMEEDPAFKQLIPYVVFQFENQLFGYTRGKSQGEQRLHAHRSIGVGGHISSDDRNLFGPSYEEAMHREVAEEVYLEGNYEQKIAGLINDDLTPVGQVHLGIVHLWKLEAPTVRPRERGLTRAGFQEIGELLEALDEFETWSQITLRALFA